MSNPWSKKESEDRINKFISEYEDLCKRHDVALMAYPDLAPSGQRGFNLTAGMIPVDKKAQGVPSPMSDNSGNIIK